VEPHSHGEHGEHGGHGDHDGKRRPFIGGLGYASIGLMTGDFSAMQKTLESPNLLGIGYGPAASSLVFGGGGGGLWNRLWIGGKGFGHSTAMASSDRGSASLSGGGGGFEIGYAAVASEEWLVVPFFGLGRFGYTLTIKNASSAPLNVYSGETVPVGGQREYSAGFFTGEVGIRASRLLLLGDGGFMVGAELGYTASLQRTAWEETSTNTTAPESAELRAAYFRLVIGGGGFSFRGGHSRAAGSVK
jgi:hypothetical protein